MTVQAFFEFCNAPAGAVAVAGADVMVKQPNGRWYRAEDDSEHLSADLADFHGHSGYSLVSDQDHRTEAGDGLSTTNDPAPSGSDPETKPEPRDS